MNVCRMSYFWWLLFDKYGKAWILYFWCGLIVSMHCAVFMSVLVGGVGGATAPQSLFLSVCLSCAVNHWKELRASNYPSQRAEASSCWCLRYQVHRTPSASVWKRNLLKCQLRSWLMSGMELSGCFWRERVKWWHKFKHVTTLYESDSCFPELCPSFIIYAGGRGESETTLSPLH